MYWRERSKLQRAIDIFSGSSFCSLKKTFSFMEETLNTYKGEMKDEN